MRYAFTIFLAAVIGGCASYPENIPPAYISPAAYETLTCQELRQEQARLLQGLVVVAALQNRATDNDAYGLILPVWPATIKFATEDYGPEIAVIKGQLAAVNQACSEKNCR